MARKKPKRKRDREVKRPTEQKPKKKPDPQPDLNVFDSDSSLSVVDLVTHTFRLWFRGPLKYALIFGLGVMAFSFVSLSVLWFLFPLLGPFLLGQVGSDILSYALNIFNLSGTNFSFSTDWPLFVAVGLILVVGATLLRSIISGPTIEYALMDYEENSANLNDAIINSQPRLTTLISTQLLIQLVQLIIVGPMLLFLFYAYGSFLVDPDGSAIARFVAETAVILAVVLVIYLNVRFLPAGAIVLREDMTVRQTLQRSFDLTSGQFWHTFISFFGILIFEFIIGALILGILSPLSAAGILGYLTPYFLIDLFFSPFRMILGSVLYKDLRSRSDLAG